MIGRASAAGPMDFHLRPYAPADGPAVTRLVESILGEHGFSSEVSRVEEDLRDAHHRYAGEGAGFWVGVVEGELVGTVAVRPKEARTCEIKRLYLRADKRGAGLGQALYSHAEAFARSAGYTKIWLDSSRRFQRAHRLYVRNGFLLVATLDNAWQDNVYEKPLGGPGTG